MELIVETQLYNGPPHEEGWAVEELISSYCGTHYIRFKNVRFILLRTTKVRGMVDAAYESDYFGFPKSGQAVYFELEGKMQNKGHDLSGGILISAPAVEPNSHYIISRIEPNVYVYNYMIY